MRRTRMRANVCVCVYTHMHERSTPLTRKLSSMDHGLRFVHANSIAETTSTAAAVVDGIEDDDDAPSESESGCKTSAMPPKPFVRLESTVLLSSPANPRQGSKYTRPTASLRPMTPAHIP